MELRTIFDLLPLIIISFVIILSILIEAFYKKSENLIYILSVITLIGTAIFSLVNLESQRLYFGDMIYSGGITNLFYFILLLAASFVIISSKNYLQRLNYHHGEYYIIILNSILGMMLMSASRDLMLTFLALELMSLSFYVLAGFIRNVLFNNEASLKYFLLGAFATGFLLYGIALIYGSAQTTNILTITSNFAQLLQKPLFILGIVLFLVGLSFKVAAVPFHMWVPDVYEGSPTTVTALMSTAGKTAAFGALIVSLYGSTGYQVKVNYETISNIIAYLATASMLLGSVVAIAQSSLKRMLAYSSIAHAGYMLIGIAAANKFGMSGVIFYLTVYSFMNIGAFILISIMESNVEKRVTLDDYSGISSTHPWYAALMSLFMFSLAGIPPFGGFFGKYYVFLAAIRADMTWLAVVGVFSSIISAYFYLRVVIYMYFKKGSTEPAIFYSYKENFVLTLCVLIILQLGLTPGLFLDLINKYL